MSSVEWIGKTIIDAFDVDIQIFAGRFLRNLRQTPLGAQFAAWAENNPIAFEVMLRAFSAAVQVAPRNHSVIAEAVRDQAARLPVELRRAILGDEPTGPSTGSSGYPLSDPDFAQRYEHALRGLSEDQLRAVARLSQARLKEWVYSPAAIRPIKLDQWAHEKTAGDQVAQLISNAWPKLKELDTKAAEAADRLEDWRLNQKWIKRSGRRQRELEARVAARRAAPGEQDQSAGGTASDTALKPSTGILVPVLVVLVAVLLVLLVLSLR